jgi:hypothetical protein
MSPPRPEDLNVLYDAALEFGENFRRPVVELAAERLPHLPPEERERLAGAVTQCRADVEDHIVGMYATYGDSWPDHAKDEAHDWIAEHFPWMSEENISHGISQGVYFAWHG